MRLASDCHEYCSRRWYVSAMSVISHVTPAEAAVEVTLPFFLLVPPRTGFVSPEAKSHPSASGLAAPQPLSMAPVVSTW